MSWYPGDRVTIILPLQRNDGSPQTVGTVPKVTILNATDGTTALASTDMQILSGTTFRFAWNTIGLSDGVYVAFVSYLADGLVVQDRFLREIVLGDSRILDQVALEVNTAKDATVAKDETVLHLSDYVRPDDSALLLAIQARLDAMPAGISSEVTSQAILSAVNDLYEASFGSLLINKSENTMVMLRRDNTPLANFQLENTNDSSSRVRT